jgi:hypothetical protein
MAVKRLSENTAGLLAREMRLHEGPWNGGLHSHLMVAVVSAARYGQTDVS